MHMRWVFLNPVKPDGWGGMENWMSRICRGLPAFGDECTILGRAGAGWEEVCDSCGARFIDFRFRMDAHPGTLARLRRIFREIRPEIVCIKGFRQARFARMASRRPAIGVKLPNPGDLTDTAMDRWTYRRCVDRILVDSHAARAGFLEIPWVLPAKVCTVHNGYDPPPVEEDSAGKRAVLSVPGIEPGIPVVAAVGRLDRGKRFQDALRTAARFPRDSLQLLIVGDGPERSSLERLVRELGGETRVVFAGWREDAARLVKGCDLLLHPSASEGFPNVVLEAMAVGVVPVATAVGGTPEMIRDGRDGFLVEPGDVDAMADRLRRLLADPGLREDFSRSAAERVRTEFSISRMVEDVRSVLVEALAMRSAGRRFPSDCGDRWRGVFFDESVRERARDWIGATGTPVKSTSKVRVVRIEDPAGDLYLKTHRPRGVAGGLKSAVRTPRSLRNFRISCLLRSTGAETVPHEAAFWRRRLLAVRESVLVTRAVPGAEDAERLFDSLAPGSTERRRLARSAGRWLGGLHAAAIRPHDLKPSNLLVRRDPGARGGFRMILLDLDNCRCGGVVRRGEIVRNLYQVHRSFVRKATVRERLEFAAAYRNKRGLNRAELRNLLRRVALRARRRGTGNR